MSETLPRSSEVEQWFRVASDALWNLEHDYTIGALAMLRSAVQAERARQDNQLA